MFALEDRPLSRLWLVAIFLASVVLTTLFFRVAADGGGWLSGAAPAFLFSVVSVGLLGAAAGWFWKRIEKTGGG